MDPEQKNVLSGVIIPLSRAAIATIILNVEPGAYWPLIALLISGDLGLYTSLFHSLMLSPLLKALGSKLGVETIANISPL